MDTIGGEVSILSIHSLGQAEPLYCRIGFFLGGGGNSNAPGGEIPAGALLRGEKHIFNISADRASGFPAPRKQGTGLIRRGRPGCGY